MLDEIMENFLLEEIHCKELYTPKLKTLRDISTWPKIKTPKPKPCKVLNYCIDGCRTVVSVKGNRCRPCHLKNRYPNPLIDDKTRYAEDLSYRESVLARNRKYYAERRNSEGKPSREELREQKLAYYATNPPTICSKCGETKPLDQFVKTSPSHRTISGRTNICKKCEYRIQAENKKKKTAARRLLREAHQEILESLGIYEEMRLQRKKETKRRGKRKERQNPMKRMHRAFEEHLRKALKGQKRTGWRSCAGWTNDELHHHLEALFQEGMSWENYGRWHVDHIKPRSMFSFTSIHDPEFKECWGLGNLQPLWAEDNVRKGSSYPL